MAELRRQRHDARIRWLEGRTLSFGRNLSYWPFIEILRSAFGIADDETEDLPCCTLSRGWPNCWTTARPMRCPTWPRC